MTVRLFSYGSLRRGSSHRLGRELWAVATHLGSARLAGVLYDLGRYPGAVPGGVEGRRIAGDVCVLHEPGPLLAMLDAHEDHRSETPDQGEFRRIQCPVELGNGESLPCWVYVYNRPTLSLTRIPDGDYLRGIDTGHDVQCKGEFRGADDE